MAESQSHTDSVCRGKKYECFAEVMQLRYQKRDMLASI